MATTKTEPPTSSVTKQKQDVTSNPNALVVNVTTASHGGCGDDGGARHRGQPHVADVHVDGNAPFALDTVVPDPLRGVIDQA